MADSERVVSLVRTIAADSGLRERLIAASEPDRVAILAELGYHDITPADVAKNAHLFAPQVVEEIDDDQLASVAGGGGVGDNTTTTVTIGVALALAT